MYYQQYKAGETPITGDITKRGHLSLLSKADKAKIRKRFTKEFTAEQRRIQRLKLDAEDKKEALNKARQQIIAGIKKDFKKKIDAAKKRKGK